jgi:hypothetical protein
MGGIVSMALLLLCTGIWRCLERSGEYWVEREHEREHEREILEPSLEPQQNEFNEGQHIDLDESFSYGFTIHKAL